MLLRFSQMVHHTDLGERGGKIPPYGRDRSGLEKLAQLEPWRNPAAMDSGVIVRHSLHPRVDTLRSVRVLGRQQHPWKGAILLSLLGWLRRTNWPHWPIRHKGKPGVLGNISSLTENR